MGLQIAFLTESPKYAPMKINDYTVLRSKQPTQL